MSANLNITSVSFHFAGKDQVSPVIEKDLCLPFSSKILVRTWPLNNSKYIHIDCSSFCLLFDINVLDGLRHLSESMTLRPGLCPFISKHRFHPVPPHLLDDLRSYPSVVDSRDQNFVHIPVISAQIESDYEFLRIKYAENRRLVKIHLVRVSWAGLVSRLLHLRPFVPLQESVSSLQGFQFQLQQGQTAVSLDFDGKGNAFFQEAESTSHLEIRWWRRNPDERTAVNPISMIYLYTVSDSETDILNAASKSSCYPQINISAAIEFAAITALFTATKDVKVPKLRSNLMGHAATFSLDMMKVLYGTSERGINSFMSGTVQMEYTDPNTLAPIEVLDPTEIEFKYNKIILGNQPWDQIQSNNTEFGLIREQHTISLDSSSPLVFQLEDTSWHDFYRLVNIFADRKHQQYPIYFKNLSSFDIKVKQVDSSLEIEVGNSAEKGVVFDYKGSGAIRVSLAQNGAPWSTPCDVSANYLT